MVKINWIDAKEKIINNHFNRKNLIIEGLSGSGKTSLAIEKYRHMIEKEGIKSENIVVFVMNRYQMITWKRALTLSNCGEFKIYNYNNFIKRELIKYWPIVEENCKVIKKGIIKPRFVSADTANYMMETLVSYFRKKRGYLLDITASSKRIAQNLVSNINNATVSLLKIEEIGERIYNSIRIKDNVNKETYEQMDKIINHYVDSFLSAAVMDNGIAVNIYNEYLLKDERYLKDLGTMEYTIVDDFDEISPAQLELINILADKNKGNYLFYNSQGAFCNYYGVDREYLENNRTFNYEEVKLEDHFLCNDNSMKLASEIDKVLSGNSDNNDFYADIKLDISSSLRSEMIEKIAENIICLVDRGVNSKDIAVLSPFNDSILIYELENKLKSKNIKVRNLFKTSRLIDNIFVHCTIVIAAFCNEDISCEFTIDDYRRFFTAVLDLDTIRASIVAKNAINFGRLVELTEDIAETIGKTAVDRYNYIKNWIEDYIINFKNHRMELAELFRRIFLDILITQPSAIKNISVCQNLSELGEKFIDILRQFNTMDNPEEKFINFVKNEAEDFYSTRELESIVLEDNGIIVGNPYNFLTSNMNSRVQIWTDVTSNMWTPRNIKELTNDYVLKRTWNKEHIYTEEIEEKNRIYTLTSIIKGLIRKCRSKIYLYGSEYSVSGYEQNGLLSDIIFKMIEERGD